MNGENFNIASASLADTGQWKLIVEISAGGIAAVLKNTDIPGIPIVEMFRQNWEDTTSPLLERIETAFYDNPRILEDFATHIIIRTQESLWIPAELTDDEEFDDNFFTGIYPAKPEDIFADFGEEEVCLYSITPGLKSFLQRTMPGSKISCHLSVMKRATEPLQAAIEGSGNYPENMIFINPRETKADFIVYSHGRFMSAVTHNRQGTVDLLYYAMLLSDTYKLNPIQTALRIVKEEDYEIDRDVDTGIEMGMLTEYFPDVSFITTENSGENRHLSVEMRLAAGETLISTQ